MRPLPRRRQATGAWDLLAMLAMLALLAPTARSWADDQQRQHRLRLEQLKAEIGQLSAELKNDQQDRSELREALRQSELVLGKIHRNIQKTMADLDRNQVRLANLKSEREQKLATWAGQREQVGRELLLAYQVDRYGPLKVLLNQQRPEALARAMVYYEYFYEARSRRIERSLATLEHIAALEEEAAEAAKAMQISRDSLRLQRETLVASQHRQRRDLARLNASIASRDQQLEKMSIDRAKLEGLLESIGHTVATFALPTTAQAFASLRGVMPWPVTGKPSNRYGGKRPAGLRWQGLSIPAREGTTVRAIHHGRVVFADWLRGFGLLLILDHGDNYLSLYAQNQALLRDVGEWVSAGAPISTVGNSGGQPRSALYFEIRKDGKPTDPGIWLRKG